MQNSLSKKRLLTRRVLPLVLAMVLLLSTAVVAFGGFGAGATGLGTNEMLYFNLSKNSSWYTNGSGDLYARFYKGSTLVGNVKCTMQSTNIYKATSPAVAAGKRTVFICSTQRTGQSRIFITGKTAAKTTARGPVKIPV